MNKLNEVLETSNVTAFGFQAFICLQDVCNKSGDEVVISTLSPALMLDKGINTYYAPVIPRNSVFNKAEDVIAADLELNEVSVEITDDIVSSDDVFIVSRHQGTIDMLKELFPSNTILKGNLMPEDIQGKKIVGVLPPALVQFADAYKAVAIKDFDYSKDNDLTGDELRQRVIITDTINVSIK